MEEAALLEHVKLSCEKYAKDRAFDMSRGAETPHLSALILQKYGLGLADAVAPLVSVQGLHDLRVFVDAKVEMIDPNWREHARVRWNLRPADVTCGD